MAGPRLARVFSAGPGVRIGVEHRMSAQPIPRLTAEEYLTAERAAEVRSEFYDGSMYAMAGGSYAHNVINVNLVRELSTALRKRGCFLVSSEARLRVSSGRVYTYPDIMAGRGGPKVGGDPEGTLLPP